MRTHKKRLLIIVCSAAVLLVLVGIVLLLNHESPKRAPVTHQPKLSWLTNSPSPTTISYAASLEDQALRRSMDYLKSRVEDIPPYERLVLDYLQRKYGLDQSFAAAKTPIQEPKPGQQEETPIFLAMRRIAYPKSLVDTLPPTKDDPMSTMMLQVVNCDRIPLSDSFGALVQQNIDAGGYNLTHVAFSLDRLVENNCNYFEPGALQGVKNKLTTGMVSIVQAADTSPDLRYEAIAFLLNMSREDLVQPSWVERLVSEQRNDGGWRQTEDVDAGSDHTAILAVWALLIWTHQPATDEPMIHRPTS